MTRITIIRHAEAEGNLYRRVHGWFDGLITPTGRLQIERLEERIRNDIREGITYDVIYSSDLKRTMETAGAVSRATGIPVIPAPGLREINSGDWEDLPWGYCFREYPELLKGYASYPEWRVSGGESTAELCERLDAEFDRIIEKNPGRSIVIVSHAVAIRALFCRIYGLTPAGISETPMVSNASLSVVEYDGSNFRDLFINDTSHLSGIVQLKSKLLDSAGFEDTHLWFRTADIGTDLPLIEKFWRESWFSVHGNLREYNGDAVKSEVARILWSNSESVYFAMLDDREIGILVMDPADVSEEGCGHISLFAIAPEYRGQHLAVQLLGQAVSFYRRLGRKYLKLRVYPENKRAIAFYEKNDFHSYGYGTGPNLDLLLMKKPI
jgi:probable phosphoglycerate mutase